MWEARESEEFQVTLGFLLEWGGAGFWKDRQNTRQVQDRSFGMEFAIDPVNIQETAGLLLGRRGYSRM